MPRFSLFCFFVSFDHPTDDDLDVLSCVKRPIWDLKSVVKIWPLTIDMPIRFGNDYIGPTNGPINGHANVFECLYSTIK